MATLHLELSEDATRKHIFGTLVSTMEEVERVAVGRVVGDIGIRTGEHFHNIAEVERAIEHSIAPEAVCEQAKKVYRILAEAEAQVHGCAVEETHFHEVGEGQTVKEILGICTAIHILAPEKITATAVQTGSGKVECAHGILDIPAPATAAILQKYEIPLTEEKLDGELCTPTSAALIAHLVDEFV